MIASKRGPLIVGAIAAVVLVLVTLFLVLPQNRRVSSAREDLDAAQAQESSLAAQLAALQEDERNAPQSRATIDEVAQQLPPTADESGYLLLLKNAATQSGIEIATIDSGVPIFEETIGLSRIPVSITVSGTYFALVEFLYNLETFPRAAVVDSAALSPAGETSTTGSPTVTMALSVTLFTTDPEAGPGAAPSVEEELPEESVSPTPSPTGSPTPTPTSTATATPTGTGEQEENSDGVTRDEV